MNVFLKNMTDGIPCQLFHSNLKSYHIDSIEAEEQEKTIEYFV